MELILHIEWGGLGDHLFWSHIPRIAKKLGHEKFFLTSSSNFRHADYKNIWTLNPYFDGFTDKPASFPVPDCTPPAGENLLDRLMLGLNLDDGERMHEPEFYYQPKLRPEFEGLVVYDSNCVAGVGDVSPRRIRSFVENTGIHVDAETKVRSGKYPLQGGATVDAKNYSLNTPQIVETPTLFDYCDMIFSAKMFLCLTSGSATLAAALRKPSTVFFGQNQPPMFRHSQLHRYVIV